MQREDVALFLLHLTGCKEERQLANCIQAATQSKRQRATVLFSAEAAAFQADRSVTNSAGGSFDYARSRMALANTLGFVGGYEGTEASVAAVPIDSVPYRCSVPNTRRGNAN